MIQTKLDSPQAVRTIFFDAGFTLIRPATPVLTICQAVLHEQRLHYDRDRLAQQMTAAERLFREMIQVNPRTWASEQEIGTFWLGYYLALLRPVVVEQDEARLELCAREIIREFRTHTRWEPYPDARPTLEALRARGFRLGIISDWEFSLPTILWGLDLAQHFDCLTVSAISRYSKPEPALFDLALQRAETIGDYALHIGDSYLLDVLGARSVGITPILIDRTGHLRPEEVDCLLIRNLGEVLELLEIPAPLGTA